MSYIQFRDNAIGMLYGAAYGDAVGTSRIVASSSEVRSESGGASNSLAGIGPNAQRLLCVCRGLVHGHRRGGGRYLVDDIRRNLQDWTERREQHHRWIRGEYRGPLGHVAPVALLCAGSPDDAFRLGVAVAKLSHTSSEQPVLSGVLCAILAQTVVGVPLERAMKNALDTFYPPFDVADVCTRLVAEACNAVKSSHRDIVDACRTAAQSKIAPDACAAIAGALAGSMAGYQAVPRSWTADETAELAQWGARLLELACEPMPLAI